MAPPDRVARTDPTASYRITFRITLAPLTNTNRFRLPAIPASSEPMPLRTTAPPVSQSGVSCESVAPRLGSDETPDPQARKSTKFALFAYFAINIMPADTKETTVILPQTGQEVRGVKVDIVESTERFSDVVLSDGTTIRVKASPVRVIRAVGYFDDEGNPLYVVTNQNTILIGNTPSHLKQGNV